MKEARELARIGANVVIKVPLIAEGLKAVKTLSGEGIKTNVTLCFNSVPALMAAKAGATYISPFVGRLDDHIFRGNGRYRRNRYIYDNYCFDTEIIVASIRNPLHIKLAALMGAHIATIPYSVFENIVKHPLTDIGLAKFLEDYKKVPK